MGNEKFDLKITDYEDKKSKAGKRYYRFDTNKGWFSCFEKDLAQKLKDNEGKRISVSGDVEESIIREFNGPAETTVDSEEPMFDEKTIKKATGGSESGDERSASIVAQCLCKVAGSIFSGVKVEKIEDIETLMKECTKAAYKSYKDIYAQLSNWKNYTSQLTC